jgi:hypothetical protein
LIDEHIVKDSHSLKLNILGCDNLRRTFSNPSGGKKNKKPVDKEPEDDDQGDQAHNTKFQDASKTVNVIFGGDGDVAEPT